MSVPGTTLTFYPLRRYDTPPFLLGAGFIAGLLVFCVWLWQRPDSGREAVRARGNGEITAELGADAGGVLSGITGESSAGGSNFITSEGQGNSFFEEEPMEEADYDAEASVEEAYAAGDADSADSMAIGDPVGAPPMEEGAALTDGLLGPAPPADDEGGGDPVYSVAGAGSAPGAPIRSYYVEVEVAPGQVQMLQLNAESPEHARAILRDFRGDPRILRGPSAEPLQ